MTPSEKGPFGELLRRYRLAEAMSQEMLAERSGLSAESVGALERGKYAVPRLKTVSLLADALRLEPEQRTALLAASLDTYVRTEIAGRVPGLPLALTPLVGREHEEVTFAHLLCQDRVRLLTLTGPGGVGKTRLALQAASGLSNAFPDGVCFVGLAALRDPDLVLSSIAQAIGLLESGSLPLAEALASHVASRRLLLVLDNFEHLLASAPRLSTLLARCSGLRMLVTSRAPLHVRGEHVYTLRPLSTPAPGRLPPLDELAGYAAVQLFVQRAQAVQPDFTLSAENVAAVSDICRRLDGLPLALELAAPYLKLFTPAALLARLVRRLAVLTGGNRDLPMRQQSLRATLDWSHELLDAEGQTLFAWLGVFEGGATLAAIEAVCSPDGNLQVLPAVRALLEHSLLLRLDGGEEARMGMLETVREYACERLAARDDGAALRRAHALYYLALTEEVDSHLHGAEQATWVRRLELERDNLRAALTWSIEVGEPGIGLRLGTALGDFWAVRGYVSEGRAWLEDALSRPISGRHAGAAAEPAMDDIRAKALAAAAALAIEQGEYGHATAHYEESLRLCRRLGDGIGCATALNGLGFVAQVEGRYERAAVLHGDSLVIMRAHADRGGMARVLNNLGLIAQLQGRYEQAKALHEESLTIKLELGHERGIAASLHNLGEVAFLQGNLEEAAMRFAESVTRKQAVGINEGAAVSLDGLAAVAGALGQPQLAARLLGAAAALRSALGTPQKLAVRPLYEPTVELARAALGEDAFAAAWQEGGKQPIEAMIAEAQQISRCTP